MSGRHATLLLLLLCGAVQLAAAADLDTIETNRLAYLLDRVEKKVGDLEVAQVTARQQVLDAGPELSRKTCEQLARQMGDAQTFKLLRDDVKQLEAKKNLKYLDDGQKQRVAAAKRRLQTLEKDSSMNCKALAPINP